MMSTQAYYKERLGFDPNEAANDAVSFDKNKQGYEENLSKFKDERDAIQKKTFTKWVNKHLKKVNRHVTDLFEDLRDGHNLISLLEVLSGEPLPRERGSMRFHMLQNVQMCLDFLFYKKIKLVNIRAEDIVDGNPKLTLGLIWTIILHFQISDIVVGQEPNVSAKDALLRWARRSTAKYPGVQVRDFTSSWRDGLAFNAIIHRNRPDLVDWAKLRKRAVRERLESAFFLAEREFGVTRLLDPEDVDTNEPDEKSLITYISSMYETFPEPPQQHPLHDSESSARLNEYRDLASDLTRWMREKMTVMQDRHFPNTLVEMKKLANESVRFRNEEVPPRQRDKQRLQQLYRELQSEVDLESSELHIEVIDRQWNRLMMAHQDRDIAIQEEIKRLERLQRLAEKVHREIKQTDSRLEELEVRIEDEARRLGHLHPLDAKRNVDALEQDIRIVEENIQTLFGDVQTLRDGRYPQAPELLKRVQKLHQRWVELRSLLHKKLIAPLSNMSFPVEERTVRREKVTVVETRLVDTNQHFLNLQECAEWVRNKLKQLQEAEYGADLPGVQTEISIHQREHKTIEQFHTKVEQCAAAKANFHGEELQLYNQHLSVLHKLYADLLTASNKRTTDLEILHDFLQSATNELMWLNEKEEVEVSRDWSDKNLNLPAVEQYYESLMSDLEKREIQFSAVLDRGEALILQHHPATKTIEAYMKAMQSQWSWVLQLTLCLETHLKHAHNSQQFFRDVKEAENWINKRDEVLNTTFSASEFSLDEGERLLKGMQELREELNAYGDVVTKLAQRAKEIVPMKQRRMPVTKPMPVVSICSYKQANANIEKGDPCVLHDNSGRIKWRVVSRAGIECQVPGVVFLLPPPDKEALEAIERLRRQFDRTVALWQKKQMRLRQNMIFATIKVVKSWDLDQFLAMGQDQRNAIRRALNEDADKLLQEGDPTDPQLRRLRREMEEVNRLFDEFERRARELEESKNATRRFNDQAGSLQQRLDEMERTLNQRINSFLPRDLDSLEHLVIEHKEFETRLQALTPEVDRVQETFRSVPQKTPALQQKLDKCLQKWNSLWNSSHLYIERLKCVEVVLSGLDEATDAVSKFEKKLASYDKMPSDMEALQRLHEDLLNLQSSVSQQQIAIDQLNEDAVNARRLVEKSRSTSGHRGVGHPDVDRLEADVERITKRWNNVCNQLVERLRSCEAGYGLLQKYADTYEAEVKFVDESYKQLNAIAPSKFRALEQVDNTKALYNSVVERAKPIEAVNVDGGRFIREAKIYDLRLQRYVDWLVDEVHPSLDAEVGSGAANGKRKRPSLDNGSGGANGNASGEGAETVARQLDVLNNRYQALLGILLDRLRQLAAMTQDPQLQLSISQMETRPLRTFRTELNMMETEEATCPQYSSRDLTDSSQIFDSGGRPVKSVASVTVTTSSREGSPLKRQANGNGVDAAAPVNGRGGATNGEGAGHPASPGAWPGSCMQFTEIRSLKRVHRSEEGVGTDGDALAAPGIVNPSTGELLSVHDAISLRVLDVRTGRIASQPDGASVDIGEAVRRRLVDPALAERLLGPCGILDTGSGREITLLEAIQRQLWDAERGTVVTPEEREKQAMEEKYRLCDESLQKLLQWIAEVEDKLANQDVVHEQVDELRNQINNLKVMKDDLDAHARPVSACLDQVRLIVSTGGELLSSVEVASLEKNGKGLRTRFDRALNRTDLLLRRLAAARDELAKFRGEMTQFASWLDKARRTLEDKERSLSNLNRLTSSADSTREFVSDVIAHQADLRFITMSAQKFVDESKEYLTVLNEFRTSLPQRLPHVEPISAQDSVVRNEVSVVTAQYKDLLNRCNALTDRLSGVGGRQREYRDAVDKARAWLKEVEPRAHKIIAEPIGADPKTVEDQLYRAKQLNNEFVANARLIDNARQALAALLRSLEGQLTPAEARDLELPVQEVEAKYNQLAEALADKCAALDTALTQSQGVQDALDGLVGWLNSSDNQLKTQWRPASLIKDRLEEQIREHRLLQAEIDSHKASVESVARAAQELVNTASNSRLAKKIESKLHDVTSRFDKLLDKVAKRGEFLDEVMASLMTFSNQATLLERWLSEMLEVLDSRELPEVAARLDDLAAKRDAKREPFDEAIRNGRNLVGQKDVTDTGPVRDRIKALESQWKELNSLLDEKTRLSRARAEQLSAYDRLREQVLEWLANMENRLSRLEAIALDAEYLKKQSEEIKPLVKEHRDYASIIDKVNDLGNAYDALAGGRPDSPARRRSGAYSPTKRLSSTASPIGRRSSQDVLLTSPVSPGGSSGFGSRRSSQDGGFHLDEVSPVQQQLTEINNRYSLLGVRLGDRQGELDSVREEVRKVLENLRTLSVFLDKVQRALPKESVPQTKEEADKMTRQIKGVLEEMYEKQSLLDGTRGSVQELLRRKPGARGADTLHDEMSEVASRWRALHDLCKARIKLMEDMKDFHDTHDSLSGWLSAKDRMLTVLGPISSDPRMVQSQVQQVQVLREEFRTQLPQLNHLLEVGDAVLSHVDRSSGDGQRIAGKVDSIQQRWNDLLGRLEERADSLGAAADTSREFDAQLTRLRDALQGISDALDDLPLDKDPEEQLRKIENLERQLEGQRPLLADVEAAGAQLCDVLTDPASRADIQAKLAAVGRQYNTLQKKLDHRKAEIEGSLRDGRQFEQSCARTLGWLSDELGSLSERLLVSADRDVLAEQLEKHEPIYKAVQNREHEIIMLLNKGRDMQARAGPRGDARNLGRDLDKIQQAWDKLRKDVSERHTRLQTCMEHCRKYYRAQEQFLPWLAQAEDKLESLQPASFKRKDIERQLKELAAFRNDVWKRSGEYESNRMLGETFVGACDIDKEIVKNELGHLKQRWDRLNNGLIERTQALEETARRLGDFGENLRDLAHAVQRCEDKLASHDALGGAARDPKMLERIRSLREEAGNLKKPLQGLRQAAGDLVKEASEHGVDAHHLQDEVDGVGDRIDELCGKLDDRCSQLQSAATAVTQFNEQVKALSHDLSALETELDGMKPAGREIKVVRAQLDEVGRFLKKVSRAADDVARAVQSGEHLVDSGFAPDTASTREQVESLRRQLGRLEERGRSREEDLDGALGRLESFYQQYTVVMEDIQRAADQVRKLKPIGSDLDSIKAQQEEFRHFRRATIEPLGSQVSDSNRAGQGLVQSAAGGVSTAQLEKDLEKLNDRWNDLKEKMNERDRKLDVGLLQSGKFQEALDGLSKWLTETEEMVAKQKPPSADYKVVKAQLQEQKFLKKMLLDRQNSMSSLFAMGNEVAANADPAERKAIERQLKDLMGRFDRLTEGAQQRMEALEMAMAVAKQFQDKLVPIVEWLDKTERKVKDLELVPTDEEKIQQKIREHDALHKEILRKKAAFTELTEVASTLMELVGEDEAAGLADKLTETTDRYTSLVEASEAVGALLQQSRQGLRHLVLTYQDLQAWMEKMEQMLNRHRVLAVHTDKLLQQMDELADLTEEIANKQTAVDGTVDSGLELMKHISNDEAIQLKDKLDSLQRRYNDLTSRGADLLKNAQEALPLVQQFHNCHTKLVDWMMGAEATLQQADPREEDIHRLELDIQEFRPVLDSINLVGPRLCQMSPGEGASTIEGLVTRDNRRFDAIAEQIQRKAERIQLSKQRSLEVISDIDELLDWFREVENQIREAEPPSSDPDVIRVQLKEHKALNDDISSQKGRVRDVLSTAKKVLRESAQQDDTGTIREKMEDLREMMEVVSGLSADRLGILEQALPLAQHFLETHATLASWLTDMERQVAMLAMPALRPDLIAQQQDRNEMFLQSLNEHKPLLDKLNKTGEALIGLVNDEEGSKVQDVMDGDNARYNALRVDLRTRQQALEKALQESSQFADKLEGMLRALTNTADQVNNMEPVSAHPPKIRDQIDDNNAIVEDLDKRQEAYDAVKRAATDVINKAGNRSDPAVSDIKRKLDRLNSLWNDVQRATSDRGKSLDEALRVAQKFWEQLHAVMATLRDLQDTLQSQEPPAVEPSVIQQQQSALQEIRHDIDQTKPEVDLCRQTGQKLMKICGEPDKPEVKKNIEDLDSAWDNITALYARREENLIDAMEKAMEFHETLQNLLAFLDKAEDKFARMGALGSDIDAVKRQISQLKDFKNEVDPHMVKVEALNRQAQELTERTSADQAAAIKEPLGAVNRRWDELLRGMVERQRQLENALLRLGQFQHALSELLAWIDNTERTLDSDLKPVPGDPQLLEVELAKLKVLVNDIQAHQSSVDTLNDAGRQLIESGKGTLEASSTQEKLSTLNRRWRELLQKAADRQTELEDALREAQRFHAEIQDLLSWLGEVDGIIAASKPVGGLPETASEQLQRFMEVYTELEENRPKVESCLAQGQEYLKKSSERRASNLEHNLRTLKQRWDSVTARANDKKIKLEIALKEATEFHDALQAFVDWLTNAEKVLSNLKPVSRVMETILQQIEEHKAFQKDVGVHRETMLNLDKKGTHLKYFSQKQDVILIKNLLISVQHRWERVVSKSAERTRALDHGYKEAREFHDAWSGLMSWLTDTEKGLEELQVEEGVGNDPERIKQRLAKHREFQRALSGKQATYDATMRAGKTLKDRAPKTDEPALRNMLTQLKNKWTAVCAMSVERQRRLEEALLYCGQFKDAVQALMDWLYKVEKVLAEDGPVHGDLDTVMALVEQHKQFEEDLSSRSAQMESVKRTGKDLIDKATAADASAIRSQLSELTSLWDKVSRLSERKTRRLEDALKEAEQLHKAVHMLLEWLSDAEMRLRFAATLPEDEQDTRAQLAEHEKFLRELREKEREKDSTIALAQRILAKAHPDGATVIKHWITIIQSRWDEVSSWAKQRETRLNDHLRSLRDLDSLLEELLSWLQGLESNLLSLEAEPLPDDLGTLRQLIQEHQEFMENTAVRQGEVDAVCKSRQVSKAPAAKDKDRRLSKPRTSLSSKDLDRESSPEYELPGRKGSRASPGREKTPDIYPHIGPRFPAKGSKGAEPQFRSPRVKLLWDKWRNVWMLSWERQRRLQEKYNYLLEMERVKNFSWDDWRRRFLKFMNHKKSRLTDLFRKMDKNNDGLIPREDFIDGIIKTKFDTSRLEMNAVADMFDHNNEGLIDWKEFIAALRPDWQEKQPSTEAEKIHDEVKRLVMLCTCRQKFRVFQVGEGKYRFGDSQKLRLVRILRSTVMVRVGGGWVALDEFLVKNDPCRAKGRTNIELREQFILADGVSQSMSAFKSKPSSSSSQRSQSISSAGPITKIRERSARSVPMGKTSTGRSSFSATSDSLSDNEGSFSRGPPTRKASAPIRSSLTPGGSLPGSRNNSRPPSRQGSKPPSRHGSNLSLDSTDEGTPSRIPTRRFTSTPSSAQRKLTAPVNGSATRPRTPTSGLTSPASGSVSRLGTIHRASSIPTLTGVGSSNSRIPIYVGASLDTQDERLPASFFSCPTSGARTPSGSSTPAPPGLGTKLTRRTSGASDTSTGAARKEKTSPSPFRL